MSQSPHAEYETVFKEDEFEIRNYKPCATASVTIQAKRRDAIKTAFRILADYIFGGNSEGRKIAMTVPVEQQEVEGGWKVSFVMPKGSQLTNLPKPINQQIVLEEIPPKTYAVIRFSGRSRDENLALHQKKLKQYLLENQRQALSNPKYAFYNPPWTLPFLKRNEVLIETDQRK